MEVKDMKLNDIAERRTAIEAELEAEGADLDAIEAEMRSLDEREADIEKELAIKEELRKKAKVAPVIETIKETKMEEERMFTYDSPEYRTAFFKHLMKQELNETEKRAMTTAVGAAGAVVPTITMNKIVEKMVQIAPLLGEVTVSNFRGAVKLPVETTVNDAALHTEVGSITPASDVIGSITLGTFEIVKVLRISAALEAASVDDFEAWVVRSLAKSMARQIENYLINGTGSGQPKGIKYANTWADTTNAVDWAGAAPTAAELEELIGLLPGGYDSNAKFLMKKATFWTNVHALRDEKNPSVVTGQAGTGFYIFGYPVIFSDYVTAGEIYFGDYSTVYANFAAPIQIAASPDSGFAYNAVDYRGACVFDCAPALPEAIRMSRATV